MNFRPLALFLLLAIPAAVAPPLTAAIDFTLRHEQTTSDAVSLSRTYVVDGPLKIYLDLPTGWQANGTATALVLVPDAPPGASARFEQIPSGAKPPTFDAPERAAFRQQAASLLPAGAKEPAFLNDEEHPLVIHGWTSYEVTHAYAFYGQLFTQSTMFLQAGPNRLLRITVTSPRADFPKVYPPVRAVMHSWFEQDLVLPSGKDAPFRGN